MSPANNRLNMNMSDMDFIRNNVTLYIVTVPAGAGGCFLGYLQRFYLGHHLKIIDEKNFPHLNKWDPAYGMFDIKDIPIVLTGQPGITELFINYKGKDKQDIINNDTNRLTNSIKKMMVWQTWLTDDKVLLPCHVFPHDFAIDFRLIFKYVEHTLAITGDLDTIKYVSQLKSVKCPKWMDGNKESVEEKAEDVYKNIQLASPLTSIDYKKFFIDVDKDEIKKFFTSTIDINEFNNDKLEPICDMIKIYTKLNKELIA